jgi:glycosyltransferase involved in cell wall biosynthesis
MSYRILILSEPYPPRHPGGAGKLARTVASGLARRGHRVDVVCIDAGSDEIEFDGDVRIHRLMVKDNSWSTAAFRERKERVLPYLELLHRENHYHLLHDVGGFLYGEVFHSFVLRSGIPAISHLLLLMRPYLVQAGVPGHFIELFHDLQKLQCGASHTVITTSKAEEDLYLKWFQPVFNNHFMVHNAVEIEKPDTGEVAKWRSVLSPDGAVIFFVGGRLNDRVKGGARAASLCDAFKRRGLKVRLVGTNLESTNGQMESWQADTRTLGRLDNADYTAVLSASDFALCPSYYEAFGLLAVEAGVVGTPVLASRTGGHLDTVGNIVKGFLLGDDDWNEPSAELEDFVRAQSTNWQPEKGMPIPETLTQDFVVDRLESIYAETQGD